MASFEYRYIGAESLPARLSEFDVQQYFRLSKADVEAISARFRADRRAGVAVMLLFLRASGRPLDRVSTLPRALLHHVGEAIGGRAPTIASLRSIYQRRPTHYEHQLWAKEYLGLKDVDKSNSDLLVAYLNAQANEVSSVDELVTSACRWLYERKLLIPSDRQVRDLARKCYANVEAAILTTVQATVPANLLARCREVVFSPRKDGASTTLEWLGVPSFSVQ